MAYVGNQPFFGFIKTEELVSVGQNTYDLERTAPSTSSIEVTVEGILKRPSQYTLTGKTLTLVGVPNGQNISVRYLTTTGTTSTYTQYVLADGIVTEPKIAIDAVTDEKIVGMAATKLIGNMSGQFTQSIFTGDATNNQVDFILPQDVAVPASIIVSISGVIQVSPNNYTLSGTGNRTLTFPNAPADGIIIQVVYLGVPTAGTITAAMVTPGLIPVHYSTDPLVTSAELYQYPVGTEWINDTDGNIFILTDDTAGANVWLSMQQRFDTLAALGLNYGQRGAIAWYNNQNQWEILAPGDEGAVLTSGGNGQDIAWGTGGAWIAATDTMTTESGKSYLVDTTSVAMTVNLPATPTVGDTVKFLDSAGYLGTQNLIISRNGNKVQGLDQDITLDVDNNYTELVYTSTANGWVVAGTNLT